MRKRLTLPVLTLCGLLLAGCEDDDGGQPFPSMWNEIVCLITDNQGHIRQMVTDGGNTYEVTNSLSGYEPGTTYRMMCGYSIREQQATLYQATGVHVLKDSTACAAHDPLKILSAWKSGTYINLHLAPLTQGGNHAWGFAVDSTRLNGHRFLSLHHRQGTDPLSYTQETYASIPLTDIPNLGDGDSITLSVHTFKGIKTWNFRR